MRSLPLPETAGCGPCGICGCALVVTRSPGLQNGRLAKEAGHGGGRQPMCDPEGCSTVWGAVKGGGGTPPPSEGGGVPPPPFVDPNPAPFPSGPVQARKHIKLTRRTVTVDCVAALQHFQSSTGCCLEFAQRPSLPLVTNHRHIYREAKKIPPAVCLKQNLRRLWRRQSTLFRATILGSVEGGGGSLPPPFGVGSRPGAPPVRRVAANCRHRCPPENIYLCFWESGVTPPPPTCASTSQVRKVTVRPGPGA